MRILIFNEPCVKNNQFAVCQTSFNTRLAMKATPSIVLSLLCACLSLSEAQENVTISVFISGLSTVPSSTPNEQSVTFVDDLDGRQFQAAVDLAVEAVNNSTDILEGYNLQVQYVDSECNAGPSTRGYIEQIFDTQERIMIIGSDCSTATEPIAELVPFWGLIQISPLSSSPALSSVADFGTFLRLVPSDVAAAMGVVTLMERFDWTRVGVLSQQETTFTSTGTELRMLLTERNFTSFTFTFNTGEDPSPFVNDLRNSPSRIIFLNVYPSYAIDVLCLAQSEGMTASQGYLWLLYPWYPIEWWKRSSGTGFTSCTPDTIETVLRGSIVIDYLPLPVDREGENEVTDAGLTRAQYETLLNERLDALDALSDMGARVDRSLLHQTHLYFDALLMGALALNTTKDTYNLSTFNYNMDDSVSQNITREIKSTAVSLSFRGVSGLIDLEGNRERIPTVINFKQYQDNGDSLVLEFIGNGSFFVDTAQIFPGGVPMDERVVFISHALFIVYTILSCLGIIFAVAVAVFLVVFRERTVIKFSSPFVDLLIIGGTVLFYMDVILFGVDEGTPAPFLTVNALCMTRIWLATIAFTLLFGTILAKIWRVYYAFLKVTRSKKKMKLKIVPDWVLFAAVGVMVFIDLLFLAIVTGVPESRLSLMNNTEIPSNTRALPQIISQCTAPQLIPWLIVLFVYKGLELLIGLFLAFETRNAKITKLKDSRFIGVSVYVVAILSLAAGIIGYLARTLVDVFYGVVGILIILCSTVVLCLIFIPKFYQLWKNPEGLRVSSPEPQESSSAFDTITGLSDEVDKLKLELNKLRAEEPNGNQLRVRTIDDSIKVEETDGSIVDKKAVHFIQN